ncbi:MAG TPA: Asd/ArgC dimerization domain-containing protein [Bryobacteraceae bacterium]|nr:Asd/ArgC dimerization domain-containing protein [Bryobacteraceae bacterium]
MAKSTHNPLAIVGGETLLGRELRDVLEQAGFENRLRVISGAGDEGRTLTEEAGEAVLLDALTAESIAGAQAVLLAGTEESSRRALQLLKGEGAPLIDLTGALEDNPAARLRAPSLEPAGYKTPPGAIHVIAHPAAFALAQFLTRLHLAEPVQRAVTLILEPVSERGKPGLDELHHQTVKLLSFQKLDKPVFDAQISFNILPEYGEDAPKPLASVEQRIEKDLASLLALQESAPMPSLRVVQAPVFHGYSLSVWTEFERTPELGRVAAALRDAGVEIRKPDEEAPTNVGAAGQSGISAGSMLADRNNPRAAWFWVVCDNLRIVADNALEVVRAIAD